MPLTMTQCSNLNAYMLRRVPNYLKKIFVDRLPHSKVYTDIYPKEEWKMGTGVAHTRETIYVTRPNDDGCWEQVSIGGEGNLTGCNTACEGQRKVIGWGSDYSTFYKYQRKYQTPPLCYDEFRNIEEIVQKVEAISQGLKPMPDMITSDFIRLFTMRSSPKLHMAGTDRTEVTVTPTTFTNNCTRINLGSADNLPSSQLTMDYLDSYTEPLLYNGYFDREFLPQGTYAITMDFQTRRRLSTQNQQTLPLVNLPGFAKAGQYYEYGLMPEKVGNWVFKYDHEQLRFQHLGNGVLERIWPFENVAATIGKKPEYSTAYLNAEYRAFHVINRDARSISSPEMGSVGGGFNFKTNRNMMGQWQWLSPDSFSYTDPNTGVPCTYFNDTHNKGYMLGEFEMGIETKFPGIEMWIIAKGQNQQVTNEPTCAASPAQAYQSLTPYNPLCASFED